MALVHKRLSTGAAPTPFYVNEPDGGGALTTAQTIQAFRWYTENCSDEKAASFLGTDVITAKRFLTLCWVERLTSRGFTFPTKETETISLMRTTLADYKAFVAEAKAATPKVNIQELTKDKAMELLGKLEAKMDSMLKEYKADFNWYDFATTAGIKAQHVPYILAEIKVIKKDVLYPERWDKVAADLERIQKMTAGTRAPRKRKLIDPSKVIGSLQFLKEHTGFKIKSIDPQKLIGAQSAWVFNTVYKTLAHYVAQGPNGLTVSGTSIKGFEPEQSISKTVRKPEAVLGDVVTKTRKQAENVLAGLTTKPGKATGRVNKDCVILKAE